MVPAHAANNSDPAHWVNPPVPEAWWQTIRDHMPAYHPAYSPTFYMGAVAETLRQFPDARRSDHPQHSFAAIGANRDALVGGETPLSGGLGDKSPLGKLYTLDGYVLLLGVGHDNNTSLHLAEHRANFPKQYVRQGSAVFVEGERQWVAFDDLDWDDEDFNALGADFEQAHPGAVQSGTVGKAPTKLIRQRALVDFGVTWLETHRRERNT
jgi:aminoglycoside 3-N-acetyltransferase